MQPLLQHISPILQEAYETIHGKQQGDVFQSFLLNIISLRFDRPLLCSSPFTWYTWVKLDDVLDLWCHIYQEITVSYSSLQRERG